MQIAVLGPTGSLGSHICIELLSRGHEVVGISRSPENLGKDKRYRPVQLDISTAKAEQFVEILKFVDVVIWAYNPPMSPDVYRELMISFPLSWTYCEDRTKKALLESYLESARRVVQAVKSLNNSSRIPYFMMIGGTGSLELPDQPFSTALDHREWWLAFRRSVADSEAATVHMIERLGGFGPPAESVRAYRTARQAMKKRNATQEHFETIRQTEDPILNGQNPFPDIPLAARAAFMMFDGNMSFKWSFLSPPAGYRPGVRSGKYEIWFDKLPMLPIAQHNSESHDESNIEARLLGVTVADLAIAVVDEAERQEKAWKHWTAVGDVGSDIVVESSARIQPESV